MDKPRIYTTKEVLARLKISHSHLCALRKREGFPIQPCKELGRGRYPADVVENYLDEINGVNPKSDAERISNIIASRIGGGRYGEHKDALSS